MNQTFVLILADRLKHDLGTWPRFEMRMNLRSEESRKRAAECAAKALCALDQEARRTFAELAEQWRTLAEHTEYLGAISLKAAPAEMGPPRPSVAMAARGIAGGEMPRPQSG